MGTGLGVYGQERMEWAQDYKIDSSDFTGEVPGMEEDDIQRFYLASH